MPYYFFIPCYFVDIVKEILDNRAEIYRALNMEAKPESEEEASGQDIDLVEHLKLQAQIARNKELGND